MGGGAAGGILSPPNQKNAKRIGSKVQAERVWYDMYGKWGQCNIMSLDIRLRKYKITIFVYRPMCPSLTFWVKLTISSIIRNWNRLKELFCGSHIKL